MQTNSRITKQRAQRGQGMTEYIIIVSLISVATIGIITLFGNNLRNLYGMAADTLAGDDNITQRNVSGAGANQALTKKTMKNAMQNNTSQY